MALHIKPRRIRPRIGHFLWAASLLEVVEKLDGRAEAGWTDCRHEYQFRASGSRVTQVDLTLRLVIRLPHWLNCYRRPEHEQREWQRFRQALLYHEQGHVAIFESEAPVMYARLKATPAAAIDGVFKKEVARIKALHAEYDRITGHGVIQQTPYGRVGIRVS